jgi:serine/threonine protein kinase
MDLEVAPTAEIARKMNRSVALKMIKAARFASDDGRRRFRDEAEAVARLDHPNIVPIFEVGQFDDRHYFSMKLIGGESLSDPKTSRPLLPTPTTDCHCSSSNAPAEPSRATISRTPCSGWSRWIVRRRPK